MGLELEAIAVVVIGGTLLTGGLGSVSGTLWGVLLLGVIQNVINLIGNLSSYYQSVVSGTFLIVVVVLQAYLGRRRWRVRESFTESQFRILPRARTKEERASVRLHKR